MTQVEELKAGARGPQVLPLSVKAYHALGDMGLIPKQTELLYGQVFHKMSKSPLHNGLAGFSACYSNALRQAASCHRNSRSPVRTRNRNLTLQSCGDARKTSGMNTPRRPSWW